MYSSEEAREIPSSLQLDTSPLYVAKLRDSYKNCHSSLFYQDTSMPCHLTRNEH